MDWKLWECCCQDTRSFKKTLCEAGLSFLGGAGFALAKAEHAHGSSSATAGSPGGTISAFTPELLRPTCAWARGRLLASRGLSCPDGNVLSSSNSMALITLSRWNLLVILQVSGHGVPSGWLSRCHITSF